MPVKPPARSAWQTPRPSSLPTRMSMSTSLYSTPPMLRGPTSASAAIMFWSVTSFTAAPSKLKVYRMRGCSISSSSTTKTLNRSAVAFSSGGLRRAASAAGAAASAAAGAPGLSGSPAGTTASNFPAPRRESRRRSRGASRCRDGTTVVHSGSSGMVKTNLAPILRKRCSSSSQSVMSCSPRCPCRASAIADARCMPRPEDAMPSGAVPSAAWKSW
mmetsp:Transcript_2693/g.7887  ORF Transcript_2693/g.7887 Transcript_2693/m.7887 type:complete len:216 (+) Transcript_2693:170-817(+)